MSPSSTIKYQGETKISTSRKSCGGGIINIYFHTLNFFNGHVESSILGKVRNSSMTVIWFTMCFHSVTFVQ